MKLYVLRHGKSPQLSEAGVARDEQRPLAEEGRDAVRRMTEHLKDKGGKPARILTSPLVRARETAQEASKVLDGPEPEETRMLGNVLSADALWERLRPELEKVSELLIVGHQPQLGELVAYLSGEMRDIKPGGLVALSFKEDRISIDWAKNPADL